MKENNENIGLDAVDRKSKAFLSGGKFVWEKSNAEIWESIESRIENQPEGRDRKLYFIKLSIAAGILLLLGLSGFLRFYTIRIETSSGQHLAINLPDQSKVELNARSKIAYHPYWWQFKRSVKLEGEAFFEVEKGRKFEVESINGTTRVLGTSFNIYARDNEYKVTCLTGQVLVKSPNGTEAILSPTDKAELQSDGQFKVSKGIETHPEISWRKNIFLFTAVPADLVFAEIERQYGVQIELPAGNASLYTGNFNKDQDIEEILNYVCPALGLKYSRISGVKYKISYENE
jgi:ferric-dicitrate binding protein FerR (iron transport regulator)